MADSSDTAALVERLDSIQALVDDLAKVREDAIQQQALAERIFREIQSTKLALRPIDSEDEDSE